jgi:hypothetical protein
MKVDVGVETQRLLWIALANAIASLACFAWAYGYVGSLDLGRVRLIVKTQMWIVAPGRA